MAESAENWLKKNWKPMLLGSLLTFLIINMTTQWAYNTGACTYNKFTCGGMTATTQPLTFGGSSGGSNCGTCDNWGGLCNREIWDACCETPKTTEACGGQTVHDSRDCGQYTCGITGYTCEADRGTYDTGLNQWTYTCGCMGPDYIYTNPT
jgi:hypothetical protein